jgi:hypothetical protein
MSEDPKKFLLRMSERVVSEAVTALRKIPESTCFFYSLECDFAGDTFELQPLHRIPGVDLFVYCDPSFNVEGSTSRADLLNLTALVNSTLVGDGLTTLEIKTGFDRPIWLKGNEAFRALLGVQPQQNIEACMLKIKRIVGNESRCFWLLCVGLDSAQVYQRLFSNQGAAPKYLCLSSGITPNTAWDGRLAQAVQENAIEPEFLMGWGEGLWPWAKPWQGLWCLKRRMFALQTRQLKRVAPDPLARNRVVVAKAAPLCPESSADADAVLLDLDKFIQYEWPKNLHIILNAPHNYRPDARTKRLNPHEYICRDLRDRPLASILHLLQEVCQERNVKHLALNRIGFEDEGPILKMWRDQAGLPNHLTVFCDLPGDLEALEGCVDRIDPART